MGTCGNSTLAVPVVQERRAQSAAPPGSAPILVSAGATIASGNGGSRGRCSSSGSDWAPVRKRVSEERKARMESLAAQVPTPQRTPDLHCRPTRDGDVQPRLLKASDADRGGARVE